MLSEESEEIGQAEDKSVIVDESAGCYLFVYLLFSSDYELDVVNGQGRDDQIEAFEVFAV